MTRSGPLPAWAAVTYTVWRSLETAWMLTWTSLSSPHLVADSLIAREYLSSAQMVSETPSEPLSDAPPPLPQPARSSISPVISRARVVRRTRMCAPQLSANEGMPWPRPPSATEELERSSCSRPRSYHDV